MTGSLIDASDNSFIRTKFYKAIYARTLYQFAHKGIRIKLCKFIAQHTRRFKSSFSLLYFSLAIINRFRDCKFSKNIFRTCWELFYFKLLNAEQCTRFQELSIQTQFYICIRKTKHLVFTDLLLLRFVWSLKNSKSIWSFQYAFSIIMNREYPVCVAIDMEICT